MANQDVFYKPLIEDMTWSYSRLTAYEQCKYAWYLKYILDETEEELFYASYGSFIHNLIEKYYRGQLSKDNMITEFLLGFSENVKGERPSNAIVEKYVKLGVEYLSEFKPFKYMMVDVEHKVEFDINGKQFVGFVDYIGKDGDDYIVIDHKSRDLKPRSGKIKPTLKDKELDTYLRQLYLYSTAIKFRFYSYPKKLCFNCFKSNTFIEEEFDINKYKEAVAWATNLVSKIENTNEFPPTLDWFYCKWLCGFHNDCCYYESAFGK